MSSPQFPDPESTPTADTAECWLRQVTPLLDALARFLSPDPGGPLSGRETDTDTDDDAARAAYARVRFSALTACPGGHTRRDATRPCRHAHVELLIAAEGGMGAGGPRYAVRVVNVDLPRWRHRDAYIAPAPTWPDRGEAAAEGMRLARERWGEVAVVHSTPSPGRADAAMDGGCA